jgi:hypothetical protein
MILAFFVLPIPPTPFRKVGSSSMAAILSGFDDTNNPEMRKERGPSWMGNDGVGWTTPRSFITAKGFLAFFALWLSLIFLRSSIKSGMVIVPRIRQGFINAQRRAEAISFVPSSLGKHQVIYRRFEYVPLGPRWFRPPSGLNPLIPRSEEERTLRNKAEKERKQ